MRSESLLRLKAGNARVRAILHANDDDLIELMTASALELRELVPAYMALIAGQDVVDVTQPAPASMEEARTLLLNECAQAVATTIEKTVSSLCERKMAKLVEAQAYIFEQRTPSPPEPSHCHRDAERYVCFLMMDSILRRCSSHGGCLIASLPGKCFEMLRTVAVEDYVRYKAYLRSLGRKHHDPFTQDSDYLGALADLDAGFVCMCPAIVREPGQVADLLERTVEKYHGNPDAVVDAKQQMLHRLGRDTVASDSIRDFVLAYGDCLSLVLARRPPRDGRCEQLRRRMTEQREIVDLFEYSTRTLLTPTPIRGHAQAV